MTFTPPPSFSSFVSLKLLSSPSSPFSTWFSTWYLVLTLLLLLLILPVCSFSRDAALVFVEAELSLEALLALGFNQAVGLSFHDSCMMLFTFYRVDFARPLEVTLGILEVMLGILEVMLEILSCALSYFSTGFEIRSDFLLDEPSDPDSCELNIGKKYLRLSLTM